jgi:hypothetical protein
MPFVLLFGPGCGVKPSMFSMCKTDGLFKLKIVDHQAIRSLYYCICSCALQRPLLLQMPNPFLNNLNILDSDTDDEDEDFMQALYLIAPDVLAQIRRNRRSQTRLYLTRPELLIHPRGRTPWQVLYHSNSDRAFITTMGLDIRTFHLLLDSGFRESWETVTDLQGPPSERTPEEKLWDFKTRAQQYARDRGSRDDTRISYLEYVESEAEADLMLARMIAG